MVGSGGVQGGRTWQPIQLPLTRCLEDRPLHTRRRAAPPLSPLHHPLAPAHTRAGQGGEAPHSRKEADDAVDVAVEELLGVGVPHRDHLGEVDQGQLLAVVDLRGKW